MEDGAEGGALSSGWKERCRALPLVSFMDGQETDPYDYWENHADICTAELAGKAQEAAGMSSGEAKGKAHEMAGEAKGKANELAGKAKGKAEEVKGKM